MSFNTLIFPVFLASVFGVYWAFHKSRLAQNLILLLASYAFYSWWDWRFSLLMLASSLIDYFAAILLETASERRARKIVLALALMGNLLILGTFKYFNFFIDSLVIGLAIIGIDVPTFPLRILLPIGISFYTFQTMGYTIDVFRGQTRACRNPVTYLAFVSFFPQLVAGPIERAAHLMPQFERPRAFSEPLARSGCRLILIGLVKKMVIADNLAPVVEQAFNAPASASTGLLLLAVFFFAFQIYCDFSGYSDVAIGSARLFGIHLVNNFATPYFSRSVTEFWRRWHISLSSWFRDYLYVPLGGNRGSLAKTCRNLGIVALLSGIWHGAGWTFVLWGALHGLYLVAERITGTSTARENPRVPQRRGGLADILRIVLTFSLVSFAWIFFRARDAGEAFLIAWKIIAGMVQPDFYVSLTGSVIEHAQLSLGIAMLLIYDWKVRAGFPRTDTIPTPLRWIGYSILFWTIIVLGTRRVAEFIYFRF